MQDPISSREASVLALLAQRDPHSLTDEDKQRILSVLDGRALQIAEAIIGTLKDPSESVKAAALGFTEWAKSLDDNGAHQREERKAESKVISMSASG